MLQIILKFLSSFYIDVIILKGFQPFFSVIPMKIVKQLMQKKSASLSLKTNSLIKTVPQSKIVQKNINFTARKAKDIKFTNKHKFSFWGEKNKEFGVFKY